MNRPFLDDGVHVTRQTSGEEGPWYVFLAGIGAEGEVFSLVADELEAAGKNVMVIEAPGFGYRDPRKKCVALSIAANEIVSSGKLPEGPIICVGHSAGAMMALELAKSTRHVMGIVTVNGILDDVARGIDRPFWWAWRYPRKAYFMAGLLIYLTARLPEFVLRRLEKPGHLLGLLFWPMIAKPWKLSARARHVLVRYNRCASAWPLLRANRHYDLPAQAELVTVPVHVLHGTHDPLATSPDKSPFLKRLRAREVPVSIAPINAGHCAPVERPEVVASEIIGFGKELPH